MRPAITASEGWEPNVAVAMAALEPYGIQVVRDDADTMVGMQFADASFDLVMSGTSPTTRRRCSGCSRPVGCSLHSRVGGRNANELRDWFRGQMSYPDVIMTRHRADATAAGFLIDAAAEWAGPMRFNDAETLVEYLGMVPREVPDFRAEEHADTLQHLDSRRPIVVEQRRFRIAARKPALVPNRC